MNYELLQGFLIAAGIGALIGAEREREKLDRINVGGFRTFVFISLLGAFTAFLTSMTGAGWIFAAVFIGVIILTALSYIYMAQKDSLGMITELLMFLTFILGFVAFIDKYSVLAIISTVAIVILTESGRIIHGFINSTSHKEWTDTLRFVAVVFLVYPLLPNRTIDPWNLINPSEIWLMVSLISGIQFIGYYLVKTFGSQKGILLNGIMGGLVSSTATTSSLANTSVSSEKYTNELVTATLLASLVKMGRILIVIWVISADLFANSLPFILIPSLILAIKAAYFHYLDSKDDSAKGDNLDLGLWSPFNFLPALKMALLFTVVKLLTQAALDYFGNSGVLITTAVSGFIDVDAITVSLSSLFSTGGIILNLAIYALLLAIIVNFLFKSGIVILQGSKEYGRKVAISFGFTIVASLCAMIAVKMVL